ncbi:MAG TPA: metalloregulator ArsR/SmtB family transcription factor [Acidimicrobiia bacterium]|nr:metalloregulator ArsR/SmtB family transcription factor [Acidimicrobiia bacterium]
MAAASPLTDAKRRILDLLKRAGATEAAAIAATLELTPTGVRQHLAELETAGLVARADTQPAGRGRPPVVWSLTEIAAELFPDRHADLTVELIAAIREAVGDDGLDQVIDVRARRQLDAYRSVLPAARAPLAERVQALADQRTAEGYMAEVRTEDDGSCLLIEHHCPVCDAAESCTGICRAELDVFRGALGRRVTVEREQHLLSGDTRCVYRIRSSTTRR